MFSRSDKSTSTITKSAVPFYCLSAACVGCEAGLQSASVSVFPAAAVFFKEAPINDLPGSKRRAHEETSSSERAGDQ